MSIVTVDSIYTTEKVIALTFDDGPHPVFTPRALAALQQYQSHATWFVLGVLAQSRTNLLKDIAIGNNDIGVHSYDHIYLTGASPAQIASQLKRTRNVIQNATGQWWPYFRPPFGAYNQNVLNTASAMGFHYNVLWSVDPRDYQASVSQIVARVMAGIEPGAIIILHEVTTPITQALPIILQEIQARGYRAVTISGLLNSITFHCRTLEVGYPYMRGPDVRTVQQMLTVKDINPGVIDGIYGSATARAVYRFQAANGLPPDGIMNVPTYNALGIKCI